MPKDKTVYSLHESVLLIILAALDKVYDADAIALGIPMYEVGTFITKVGEKLAQRELCSPDEATKHSAMKLVHNSKFALLKIVNGLDEEQVIESVSILSNVVSMIIPENAFISTSCSLIH